MKLRRFFGARLCVLIALFLRLLTATGVAVTTTHTFELPNGGGKMTVTAVGPKGGETQHLTWTHTDKDGNKVADGKAKNTGNGVKSEWKQYDKSGKVTANGEGSSSPTEDRNVTWDKATGNKTTHWVKKNDKGQKVEEGTQTNDKATGQTTTSVTTYLPTNGLPTDTTITKTDAAGNATTERQIWDQNGKQVGGSIEGGGKKFDFDPKKGVYNDPGKTKPGNPSPPNYSRIARAEEPFKPYIKVGIDEEWLKKMLSDESERGSHPADKIGWVAYSGATLASAGGQSGGNPSAGPPTTHWWEPLLKRRTSPDYQPVSSRSNVAPGSADALFPQGLTFGAGPVVVFGAGKQVVTETSHKKVPVEITVDRPVVVGERLVDADGIPGGLDIRVPVFQDMPHVIHGFRTETNTFTRDIGNFDDDAVGGSLSFIYWLPQDRFGPNLLAQLGLGVSNDILSGNGGAVDIPRANAYLRFPFVTECCCVRTPLGVAPFLTVGFGGVFGRQNLANGDVGAGVRFATPSGFYVDSQMIWNFNGQQNFWEAGLNFGLEVHF